MKAMIAESKSLLRRKSAMDVSIPSRIEQARALRLPD
jgi:hypothetical protein